MENGKIVAFSTVNAFLEEEFDLKSVLGIFLEDLTSFPSELDNVSLPTVSKKHLTLCEFPSRCQRYRFIQKLIALVNSWLYWKVGSCEREIPKSFFDSSLGKRPVCGTRSIWALFAGNKRSFAFSCYISLWSWFFSTSYD